MSIPTERRSRAKRPLVALAAVFIGLGGIGAAAGTALGAVGAAPTAHVGGDHRHPDAGPASRMEH